MRRRRAPLVIALVGACVAALPVWGQGAGTLHGRVVDAETGEGLPGVNVFLAYTTRGSSTDADGYYQIAAVPPGAYQLGASMIGYAPETRSVQIGTASVRTSFRLRSVAYDLEEVAVVGERRPDWQRHFRVFREQFLGTSDFASEAEIVNPYALDFEVAPVTRVLTATADESLEIENRALGYRLFFQLEQFSWDPQTEQVRYAGLPRFEPLTPRDEKQARRWEQNRETAFRGSLPHLLRSMAAGTAFDEGFQLVLREQTNTRRLDGTELLRDTPLSYEHVLSMSGDLHVRFRGFGRGGILRRRTYEYGYVVRLVGPGAIVNADGHVSPVNVLQTVRYPKRVADLVPRHYGLDLPDVPGPPADRPAPVVALAPLGSAYVVAGEHPAGTPALPVPEAGERALEVMQAQRWERAAALLDDALAARPDDVDLQYLRAICQRERASVHPYHDERYRPTSDYEDRWTKAIDRFESLVRRDSTYRDVLYQYALLWRGAGKYDRALRLAHAQVRVRPDLWHVRHGLFALYRAFVYGRPPERAFEGLADRDSDYAALFRAEAHRLSGDLLGAEVVLRDLLHGDPAIPLQPVYLSLARAYFAQGKTAEAQALVERAVDEIDGPLAAALVFDDVKYITSGEELEAYRQMESADDLKSYFKAFWARRDPVPAERLNRRMAEHYRRLAVAERDLVFTGRRQWLGDADPLDRLVFPPGYELNDLFDDRGLIFIRHGEPDEVISTVSALAEDRHAARPGGVDDMNSFKSLAGRGLGGREDSPDSASASWQPNVSWRYNSPRMDFHFIVSGGGANWQLAPTPPLHRAALYDRMAWGGLYADMFLNPHPHLVLELEEQSRAQASLGLTTDRHTWADDAVEPFDVPFIAAAFRGEDGRDRLELHYVLPAGLITERSEGEDSLRVELGVAAHDTLWREHAAYVQPVALPRTEDPEGALTGSLSLNLPADTLHLAFHARPLGTSLLASYRFERRLPDFSGTELAMSDLLPAFRIQTDWAVETPGRADFRIVPNPYLRFAVDGPLFVYFEVYNLAFGEDDRAHYSVAYTLQAFERGGLQRLLGRRDGLALSVAAQREGSATASSEYAELDVSRVPPGRYRLAVTVTDETTRRAVTRSVPVELFRP